MPSNLNKQPENNCVCPYCKIAYYKELPDMPVCFYKESGLYVVVCRYCTENRWQYNSELNKMELKVR